MTKPVILIISHKDGSEWRKVVRETWLPSCATVAHRFIVGKESPVDNVDIEWFPVPDGYEGISLKVRAALDWAMRYGFTHAFVCYCDTYVNVKRLLESGYERHHYTGYVPKEPEMHFTYMPLKADKKGRYAYASGGCGYWLDRTCMEVLTSQQPTSNYDDVWIGTALGLAGITCFTDPRYGFKGEQLYTKDQITVHLSKATGEFDPAWIRRAHARSK